MKHKESGMYAVFEKLNKAGGEIAGQDVDVDAQRPLNRLVSAEGAALLSLHRAISCLSMDDVLMAVSAHALMRGQDSIAERLICFVRRTHK